MPQVIHFFITRFPNEQAQRLERIEKYLRELLGLED